MLIYNYYPRLYESFLGKAGGRQGDGRGRQGKGRGTARGRQGAARGMASGDGIVDDGGTLMHIT